MFRLNNFLTTEQYTHYLGYVQEFLENYPNQQIAYYRTRINTKNEAFNETDLNQVDFDDPIMLNGLVEIKSKENKTYSQNQAGRYEEYGNLHFWVLETTLKNLNISIKYGDVIGYYIKDDYIFFTVNDSDVKNVSNDKTFAGFQPAFKEIIASPSNEEIYKYM